MKSLTNTIAQYPLYFFAFTPDFDSGLNAALTLIYSASTRVAKNSFHFKYFFQKPLIIQILNLDS